MTPLTIAVGRRLPTWPGPHEEGGEFNCDAMGIRLRVSFKAPTAQEVKAFRSSPIKLGLLRGGLHTLFIVYGIAGCTGEWADANFATGLISQEGRNPPERSATAGFLLTSYFTDASNGMVHGVRAATMTPNFSSVLERMLAEQVVNLPSFSREAHLAEIAAGHARWPTPAHMAKDAEIIETLGMPFRKP